MTGTHRAGSYRTLLARPHVLRPFLLAALGRLGYAMLPLLLLFTIRDASASFPTATAAMSAFGLAGLATPFTARLIDRHGQARVLPVLALSTLVATETVVLLAAHHPGLPVATWVLLAAVAGITAPPLGPSTRAQWRSIAPDDIDTAYALDATTEEVLWLAGPAIAGTLLTTTGASAGLSIVPVLLLVGAIGLSTSRWRPSPAAARHKAAPRTALSARTLWPVLGTMGLVGAASATLLTAVAGAADAMGARGLAAVGEVAAGLGAVAGGFLWGHRRPPWSRRTTLVALVLAWAGVVAAVRALGITAPALALLTLAGATSAPVWVLAYGAADEAVEEDARTEASTWVTTVTNLGSAAGTAMTGSVAAGWGALAPLTLAALIATAAAALTAVSWRTGD